MKTRIISAVFSVIAIASVACAQKTKDANQASATSPSSHYEIKPSDLPPAKLETDVTNGPRMVPRPEGAKLNLPPGFEATTFAEGGFTRPRWMALAPNGDVFLSDSAPLGKIIILRDTNKDGVADERFTFVENQLQPFGVAFWKDYLYVGNTNAVVRFAYAPGQTKASGPGEKIADLPGKGYREHWTRNILFSPDGKKMYVTVGSESNVSVEADPMRAAIMNTTLMEPAGESLPRARAIQSGWTGLKTDCGRPCRNAIVWVTICRRITLLKLKTGASTVGHMLITDPTKIRATRASGLIS